MTSLHYYSTVSLPERLPYRNSVNVGLSVSLLYSHGSAVVATLSLFGVNKRYATRPNSVTVAFHDVTPVCVQIDRSHAVYRQFNYTDIKLKMI